GVPSVDGQLDRCGAATGRARRTCYENLDRTLMTNVVPWVPYLWQYAAHITGPHVTKWSFDQFSGAIGYAHVAPAGERRGRYSVVSASLPRFPRSNASPASAACSSGNTSATGTCSSPLLASFASGVSVDGSTASAMTLSSTTPLPPVPAAPIGEAT